ncbi:hypothetical protein KM043_013251 [Ampulex compressa]|nr:hypothetical protein KM043_013251 [Ampulex compressa]
MEAGSKAEAAKGRESGEHLMRSDFISKQNPSNIRKQTVPSPRFCPLAALTQQAPRFHPAPALGTHELFVLKSSSPDARGMPPRSLPRYFIFTSNHAYLIAEAARSTFPKS